MNMRSPSRTEAITALDAVLPNGGLMTADEDLARFSRDWSGDHYGQPLAVARPSSAEETATVMRLCSERRIPVVPQGGLTGLVGAAVAAPGGGELVISLERLDAVRMVDPIDFAMIVEAGCILENAKKAAEAADCLLPITFGAQGSCPHRRQHRHQRRRHQRSALRHDARPRFGPRGRTQRRADLERP